MAIRAASFFATLALLGACVPSNRSIIAQQDAKVSTARAKALADLRELNFAHSREIKAAFARWHSLIIFPVCDSSVPPGNRCGLIADKVAAPQFQGEFAETHCNPVPDDAPQDFCARRLVDTFFASVRKRYELDPADCCEGKQCDSALTTELAMLGAFNDAIEARSQNEAATIDSTYAARSDAIVARFGADVQNVDNETNNRLDQANRQRAAWLAVAEGMSASRAMASSRSAASFPSVAMPPPGTAGMSQGDAGRFESAARSAGKCASDYQCAYGSRCVKDSGATQGICAKSVNSYGVPTFEAPRSDSVQIGVGECSFDTECSVGFKCVKTSNGLRGNCLKVK